MKKEYKRHLAFRVLFGALLRISDPSPLRVMQFFCAFRHLKLCWLSGGTGVTLQLKQDDVP